MDAEGHVMADERYEWLDKDAAERLLRGEPVDPVGGQSCTDAERLVAALDAAARTARPATGELPGEAAALAAFRTATHSARARTRANAQPRGATENAGRPAGAEMLEPVRIGATLVGSVPSGDSRRIRSSRWSRPVRFGLVASLAGCALGGVAVAAGTGMLPGPFGGHAPLPATSVSAAATPEELGSGLTEEETPQPPPAASPSADTSTPPAAPSTPAGAPDPGGSGRAKEHKGGDDRKPGGAATGSTAGPRNGELPESSGKTGSGEWYAKALKACRDYRDGKLDDKRRRKLEALAKGARNLDRFCDRVIARSGQGQNNQGDDGDDDEQGNDGSNWNNGIGFGSGMPSSIRFANGVRLPQTPVSLTPSARTPG
ncbi:hypothetical protein [Streptomyces sp. NBC_01363]|uniref:hypothetical protein n=1 Tax=Streptomyces sp. NBC_01363 TaxID=2903840 RepID=UPI00224E1356|nr:hypothetical protein [Streptomyces sp. NBC_01363]MCX4729990.1 hypothetical protein [Streptomyces sp. NBC_01363]